MKTFFGLMLSLLTVPTGLLGEAVGSYQYLMVTASDSTVLTYQLETRPEAVVRYTKKNQTEVSYLHPDMSNRRWEWTDPDNSTDIVAVRDGNRITIKGRFKGEPIDRVAKIEDVPWYQNPGFNLPQFMRSEAKEIRYLVLRPQDLKDFVMCGVKESKESIALRSGPVDALTLKVTICGWMSRLWSARYWFRPADGFYLKYRGVQGPPGTPETLVEFIVTNQ